RAARNARAEESSAGLLGGKTAIDHVVTIDLASSLGYPAQVEVLDRLPISDEKSIEVSILSARPKPDPYDQAARGHPVRGGGLGWEGGGGGGANPTLALGCRLALPAKSEVVGGNRRE